MIPISKIKEIASARGEKNALIFGKEKVSWSDFYTKALNVSTNLEQKIDSKKNDLTMCYISPNCLGLIYLMSAASSLKIPCTGIDYTQSSEKIESMLKSTGCNLLVVSSSYCIENNVNLQKLAQNITIIDLDNKLNDSINLCDLLATPVSTSDLNPQHRPRAGSNFSY